MRTGTVVHSPLTVEQIDRMIENMREQAEDALAQRGIELGERDSLTLLDYMANFVRNLGLEGCQP